MCETFQKEEEEEETLLRYLLNERQQFGNDGVGHFVHSVQSRDDGGGVEGEDHSELGATSRLTRVRLKEEQENKKEEEEEKNKNKKEEEEKKKKTD